MPITYPVLTGEAPSFYSVFVAQNERTNTIWLEGTLDLCSEQSLTATATSLRHDHRPITIDLSRVTFCDCRLTNFIADLQRDHTTCLRDAPKTLIELMRLTGLDLNQEPTLPPTWPLSERGVDVRSLRSSVAAAEVVL